MKIRINEKEYPLYVTMGALLRYKRETGHDVSELKDGDLEAMMMLMWCCVACASQAHGIDFPLDFETFCNSNTLEEVKRWRDQTESSGGQKKMPPEAKAAKA